MAFPYLFVMNILTGHIYKITSPTGRVYVGKTTRLNDRISYYRNNNNKQQKIISSSIEKYGWDQHIFEVIDEAPVDKLNELEIKYIKELNTFHYDNPNGMNLTRGGEGLNGRKLSAETIALMVAKRTGLKRSEATKKLMSELKKGKVPACTKNPKSEYFLQRARESSLGRIPSEDEIFKRKQARLNRLIEQHEAILQIDIDGNIIKEWQMLPKDIAKHFNVCDTNIVKCLNKKQKKGLGYIWKYKK
jgi:group I intron endonuclease